MVMKCDVTLEENACGFWVNIGCAGEMLLTVCGFVIRSRRYVGMVCCVKYGKKKKLLERRLSRVDADLLTKYAFLNPLYGGFQKWWYP